MRRAMIVLLAGLLLGGTAAGYAKELRLAYVDSDRILEASDDFKQVKQKLQEEERGYIQQATSLEDALKSMSEELRAQSLMLSEDARKEREQRFFDKQKELDDFRKQIWGENGKLFEKNLELSRPVLDKINSAIQKVSDEYGYDFVFDAANANIVFALPEYDVTDKVIDLLKKE